ncbi:hypothetical protein TVAG_101490 [Trichomonas vaginalis G3]|uniref:Uncharacterized protein n=1 Tax=Trichomonas vaginalis (strain ATCC PRA-98 / G3) TaxID=412133 RepID=A2DJN1_TRIV3|nr:hypothetical protein TVAGG3_1035520 [Trichomonas vaginalis G3]EAY19431.1 hypothetical protein TVAG_101490 [Trichomonas vaginalis G3]KAI5493167.1 hypothetical protein TVAGG3_1035520 [Trichomonas vaginalis G3]|eukprot:XP_001580417.1 hypothetical protein [Trichomonas vaginalis G3]
MKPNSLDWNIGNGEGVGSDAWASGSSFNPKAEEPNSFLNALAHYFVNSQSRTSENHISRADGIAFAEQYRSITFSILTDSDTPLSTGRIHELISKSHPSLAQLLDQRKSTSCMAKSLVEDPQKRFLKFQSEVNKKSATYFGIVGKVYNQEEWTIKHLPEKSENQSHTNDLKQAELIREFVKSMLMQRGNTPLTTNQIAALIKEQNFELSNLIESKNRNYLVKTLRRDPKKRFTITKGAGGCASFSLS